MIVHDCELCRGIEHANSGTRALHRLYSCHCSHCYRDIPVFVVHETAPEVRERQYQARAEAAAL